MRTSGGRPWRLKYNRYRVERDHPFVLRELLRDELISAARITEDTTTVGEKDDEDMTTTKKKKNTNVEDGDGFTVTTKAEEMEENLRMLKEMDGDDDDDDDDDYDDEEEEDDATGSGIRRRKKNTIAPKTTVSFQIKAEDVEIVKRRAIDLDYPLMEEYDFRNDTTNPDVPMDLKPNTRIRRYQERSLSKMFGNGRAGIRCIGNRSAWHCRSWADRCGR